MVPLRREKNTPALRAWMQMIKDPNEMQKFFSKVKDVFRKNSTPISKGEKRDEDLTTDASNIPDSPEIRCPKTHIPSKCLPVNSSVGKLEELVKNTVNHDGPAEGVTSATTPHNSPPKILRQQWSVSDAVNGCPRLAEIPEEKQIEIVTRINKAVQSLPEYFYDFCMVSSDEDHADAKNLKDKISANYNLRGCTLYEDDFFRLGEDTFEAYENMMDRSTKIFFYISTSMNENAFCRRLQSASVFQSLMSKVRREKEKCVPVFPNGLCRVALPLSGIAGLEIPKESLTAQRIRITYGEDVRNQRISQEQERWKINFLKMLIEEVEKYLQEDKKDVVESSSPFDTDSRNKGENRGENSGENCSSSPPNASGIPPSGMFDGVQDLLQTATSAPVVTSSEINIDSTTAHIGHNITIHVHCHQTHEQNSNDARGSISTSSDSDND